jgi:hypothetical protein
MHREADDEIMGKFYELFMAFAKPTPSNGWDNLKKGGNDNGLHNSVSASNGDVDEAGRAGYYLPAGRAVDFKNNHGTPAAAHELGRGHRQRWQPTAPRTLADSRPRIERTWL